MVGWVGMVGVGAEVRGGDRGGGEGRRRGGGEGGEGGRGAGGGGEGGGGKHTHSRASPPLALYPQYVFT